MQHGDSSQVPKRTGVSRPEGGSSVSAGWDDITVRLVPTSVIVWDMREADEQVFGGSFKNNPTYLLPLER